MDEILRSLALFRAESVLTAVLLLVVLVDAGGAPWRNAVTRGLTVAGLAAALLLLVRLSASGVSEEIFSGMLVVDPLANFFKVLLVLAALLLVLSFTFRNSRELRGLGQGEFYVLLLALTLSNMLMATAADLVMLYLALEMVSITSYVMVAYLKGDRLSNEASLKYVLFGAVSTGAMLYGLSLLYGLTGQTSLAGIQEALTGGLGDPRPVYVIAILIIAGFGFKTASVPFHFWCPDVYQGAATPVTALLSVAPKAAAFALLLRFFFQGFAQPGGTAWELAATIDWPMLLLVISVVTMTVGNVAALTQTDMKRLLAYSSIAHAGYVMMGAVALSENGARGVMVYLLAYLVMNLGAFLVVMLVHLHEGSFDLRDYPGLYRRAPFLTAVMAICLLSLMGIPPLVGFMGKLYVFAAVIEQGSPARPTLWWFAVVGAVNAAIAAYYYARVLKTMIIDAGGEDKPPLVLATADRLWLAGFAAANVVPLLFWGSIEGWAKASLVFYAGR